MASFYGSSNYGSSNIFARFCASAFFFVFFVGLMLATNAYAKDPDAKDKIKFQLDWLPGGDKAPIYVGVDQGFFTAEGIDVTILSGRGSTDSITKVATGRADLGLTDISALLDAEVDRDLPVKAIYNVFSEAAHAFYVLESSQIKSIADIKDKEVGTSPFTSSNAFLPLLLQNNNLPTDAVKLIKADPGALNPMLLNGRVDAIISWLTDTQKYQSQAEKAGKSIRTIPWSAAGLSIYSTSIIGNETFIQKNPELIQRFLRAYQKAIVFTWENPEKSGVSINNMVPEVDANEAAKTIESIRSLVYNGSSDKDGIGHFSPERLQKTWQMTAKARGYAIDSFDPESSVDRSYMPSSYTNKGN